MHSPYEILGVSPTATDEEVTRAYQTILDKYNPENHAGNPLADLARERIAEANDAYQELMGQRAAAREPSQHLDIRRLINSNRITEAEELLEGVPLGGRDAEWFFLKGSVQHSRGWLEDAYSNFSRAVEMNPGNAEYRAALSQLQWQRQSARPLESYQQQPGTSLQGCSICDMCATMYCASCCCQCCGGGCH